MFLNSIFSQICNKIKEPKEISKRFADLKCDEDRFSLAYDVCINHISKLDFVKVSKSNESSEKIRKAGNEKFAKNLYWEALVLYNECIAKAPIESEQLAFGFGNRATCLLKLGFPKKALEDVERGLELPITNNFKNKLIVRKEKCLNDINHNKSSDVLIGKGELVSVTKGKSSVIDCASELVQLFFDEYYERQLLAVDDIKSGDVLVVEKPYSSVLLADNYYTHCAHCFIRSVNMIPCNECSQAMFCCKECKTTADESYHQIECSILNFLVNLKAERMELLSLRILIEASKQGEKLEDLQQKTLEYFSDSSVYKSLDFKNIFNLVTNSDKRSASDLFYRAMVSVTLVYLLENHTKFFRSSGDKVFAGGLLLRFMQSLPCNAHEISEFSEDGLIEIGAGAYATLSLINHSCDPNVVRHLCGNVVVLRAIRPIKKGEQILDNYGYHYATQSINERQASLAKQYYFKCQCKACTENWPTYKHLPDKHLIPKKKIDMTEYQQLTDKFEGNVQKIIDGSFDLDLVIENLKYLDFLDEFVQRPWRDYNRCQEAIKQCLSFYGNHFRFTRRVVKE